MLKRALFLVSSITIIVLAFQSCTPEDPDPFETPIGMSADNVWVIDEIAEGEITWYKVTADESFTTLYIEWSEFEYHGSNKEYTADIKVSAYKLDGTTAYFENKDNGYGEKIKSFSLESEKEVLLKIELNDETKPGTYAIRATGTSDLGEIDYNTLPVIDEWMLDSISSGEVKGYLVEAGESDRLAIVWAEDGSPESGYTAEIMGSVLYLDGETPYKDVNNGKDILNKNKSESDDPKVIQVDTDEGSFKIHIQVNSAPGTYALKVVPYE